MVKAGRGPQTLPWVILAWAAPLPPTPFLIEYVANLQSPPNPAMHLAC
jgi:hypothetical protein